MFALSPRLEAGWHDLLLLVYLYGKGAALILAMTFVLHLLLRARWIALVGMHSVYPDGIRWERLRIGPIQREVERAGDRPFADIVERADNRATIVFATGVMLALMLVVIALLATAMTGLATLASSLSGGRFGPVSALLAVFAIVILPYSVAMLVDLRLGKRIAPGGLGHRMMRGLFRLYGRIGFNRGGNPVMALLGSHGGDRKTTFATIAIILVALALASLSQLFLESPRAMGSYGLFPAVQGPQAIEVAHYDDQRDPGRDPALPYIPSMATTAPWLRLVVPYRPERDAAAMRRGCAHADALADEAQAAARLACLAALHAVALDGKPLEGLRFDVARDPRTNRPALLAMIDVRDLPRGRHELRIARPPQEDKDGGSNSKREPDFDLIPFWR